MLGHVVTNVLIMRIVVVQEVSNSKVHEANMGPIWVLSAPVGSHVVFFISQAYRPETLHCRTCIIRSQFSQTLEIT